MNIVLLDKDTLGQDIDLTILNQFGNLKSYNYTNPSDTISRLKECDIVITNKVIIDKEVMDNTNIKLICISATGTNNVDLEYAKVKNIIVKNVAGYSTNSVAQLTFAYVLHFIHNIAYYNEYVSNGLWEKSNIFTHIDLPFIELSEKNWGIIGLGNIGSKVASIASSFGANVSYYSTTGTNHNTNYNSKTLKEILKESDIISIHSPLNEKTLNLLNYSNMKLLKDKAIIVNVARGGIINEYDIQKILEEKDIFFALDTVSKEPIEKESPLNSIKTNKNLIITPHIAWASIESRKKLIIGVAKNIKEFLEGDKR